MISEIEAHGDWSVFLPPIPVANPAWWIAQQLDLITTHGKERGWRFEDEFDGACQRCVTP